MREPDTGVVLRPGAGFSLMEHTNSLNGIDVSAKCLHRPLLTYLMNHFQQTATPTNNNDPSFLNIKRSKYSTEHRRDTFAVLRSKLQAMEAKYKGGRKINLEMNETSPVCCCPGLGFALSSSFRFDDDRL